eukprot:TRINITY_DN52610_c0_g1_i1.p1 TRINITY_DN52610_c0_g1~~TRINITY_DN52610_c0_g1_i1.p1  ORF type:complete len:698 (-),score=118.39 TRINITY_DN52610_c0_g1_i1:1219-3291(-)
MAEAFKVFEAFDRIGAGSVTKEELKGAFKVLQKDPSDAELDAMIAYVDAEQKTGPAKCPEVLSVEVGNGVHRHYTSEGGFKTTVDQCPDAKTAYDLFKFATEKYADVNWSGTRKDDGPYEWKTYKQVAEEVAAFGAGLVGLCEVPEQAKIGVCSQTRHEWLVVRQANVCYNIVTATMYDTYGEDAMSFIINHTDLATIVVQDTKLGKIAGLLPNCPVVKHVIVIGTAKEEDQKAVAAHAKVHSWEEVLEYGRKNPVPARPPKPDDQALICYTSGTTGEPKGVVHRHSGLVTTLATTPLSGFEPGSIHVSFLPMAHIMELYLQDCFMLIGVSFAFYRGDPLKLIEDVQAAKPHVFITVPRLLVRLYDKMMAGINATEGIKRQIFDMAYASKQKRLKQGFVRSFWDFIAFKPLQAVLGGRVFYFGTGSAPISPTMLEFFRIVFSSTVVEGYGMSEVLITNFSDPYDFNPGTVGPPLPHVEQKLESVPDMGYHADANPPRGEICFRGPTLMTEYFKRPDLTSETIDKDGWLHSGDIGQWEPNGAMRIIDRKKNIFKLSQGEYIAPEKVENIYVRSKFVAQAFVTGDSLKSFLVGVIIPDPEVLGPWAKENGIEGDVAALLKNEKVKETVLKDILDTAAANKLNKLEMVKDIALHGEAFSVENGCLTPSFKLKRIEVTKKFKAVTDELYAKNGA